MSQPIFGIVLAGLPITIQPASIPSSTSFLYALPTSPKSFSHVVVFLLPGINLPPNTAAAIYLVTLPASSSSTGSTDPVSTFIGGIGPGKESAIFKLNSADGANVSAPGSGNVVLGISLEDAGEVERRMGELKGGMMAGSSGSGGGSDPSSSSAMVLAARGGGGKQPSTLVLAQRIIRNAFNFLASFSGQAGQVEVVPLKAFEGWWHKFESRVKSDPGFLERDED